MTPPRLPIGPLLAAAAASTDRRSACHAATAGIGAATLADMFGVTRRTVARWLAAGSVPFYMADAAAIALDAHPVQVWGEQFLTA